MSNASHKKSVVTNVGVRQAKARKDTIILDGGDCAYNVARPYDMLYTFRACNFQTSGNTYYQEWNVTKHSLKYTFTDFVTEESLSNKGFVSPDDVLRLPRITES